MARSGSINADAFGISQYFGENPSYYARYGLKGHHGLDTKQTIGKIVYAEEKCKVIGVYPNAGTAGNMVICRSFKKLPSQCVWRYLHLSKIVVSKGRVLQRGAKIGLAGDTGDTDGPHLHMDCTPVLWYTSIPLKPFNGYKGKVDPLLRLKPYRR